MFYGAQVSANLIEAASDLLRVSHTARAFMQVKCYLIESRNTALQVMVINVNWEIVVTITWPSRFVGTACLAYGRVEPFINDNKREVGPIWVLSMWAGHIAQYTDENCLDSRILFTTIIRIPIITQKMSDMSVPMAAENCDGWCWPVVLPSELLILLWQAEREQSVREHSTPNMHYSQ